MFHSGKENEIILNYDFLKSFSTMDGEVFGQRRDQAELLDGTTIILSQEQLRKVSKVLSHRVPSDHKSVSGTTQEGE